MRLFILTLFVMVKRNNSKQFSQKKERKTLHKYGTSKWLDITFSKINKNIKYIDVCILIFMYIHIYLCV